MDRALALVAKGRAMKAVCEALEVARPHAHVRVHRPKDRRDGRMDRTPANNEKQLVETRQHIADLPSDGPDQLIPKSAPPSKPKHRGSGSIRHASMPAASATD